MNAKDKAIELVGRMKMYQYPSALEMKMAKASASIAVQEIIDLLEDWRQDEITIGYWEDVRTEIDKL